jgi:hypothetical protein
MRILLVWILETSLIEEIGDFDITAVRITNAWLNLTKELQWKIYDVNLQV